MNLDEDIVRRTFRAEDFDLLLEGLLAEIEAWNYRVTKIYDIDNIYDRRAQGIDVAIGFRRYKIVEFCNLITCNELISTNLLAGVFMPARYAVFQSKDDARINIAFVKPVALVRPFESEPLTRAAAKLTEDMISVVDGIVY